MFSSIVCTYSFKKSPLVRISSIWKRVGNPESWAPLLAFSFSPWRWWCYWTSMPACLHISWLPRLLPEGLPPGSYTGFIPRHLIHSGGRPHSSQAAFKALSWILTEPGWLSLEMKAAMRICKGKEALVCVRGKLAVGECAGKMDLTLLWQNLKDIWFKF